MATAEQHEALSSSLGIPANQFLMESGFYDAHVTSAGAELFDEQPDILDQFAMAASDIFENPDSPYWQEFKISEGYFSSVYQLPTYPGHCVKISRPQRKGGMTGVVVPPSDLLSEVRIMDAISARLASRPEHDIHAPRHYAAVAQNSDRGAYAMLMERLPAGLISMGDYVDTHAIPLSERVEIARGLKERLWAAIGFSPVRLFIDDFTINRGGLERVNRYNTFFHPDRVPQESPLHLIDLSQPGSRQRLARFVLRGA